MKLLASAPLNGFYSLLLHLTKNTCFSSPPARTAPRFVSRRVFCAANPDGLSKGAETRILRFPVVLIGYMRCRSSDERQVADPQLKVLLAARVNGHHLHKHK